MNTPEVERAAEVLRNWVRFFEHEKAAEKLSTLNLLRTEADRLNAELADAIMEYLKHHRLAVHNFDLTCAGAHRDACMAAAKAVHEHRNPKPVERWQVGNGGAGVLYTVFEAGHPTNGIVGYFPSRGHAESFAKALNAEEGAK